MLTFWDQPKLRYHNLANDILELKLLNVITINLINTLSWSFELLVPHEYKFK
jgi:hypothetical protein